MLLTNIFLGDREHAAGATRGVIERLGSRALLAVRVAFRKEKPDHQPDHFTRREMLTGRFVGLLRELADELFKDVAHFVVGHASWAEIDAGEPGEDQMQQS